MRASLGRVGTGIALVTAGLALMLTDASDPWTGTVTVIAVLSIGLGVVIIVTESVVTAIGMYTRRRPRADWEAVGQVRRRWQAAADAPETQWRDVRDLERETEKLLRWHPQALERFSDKEHGRVVSGQPVHKRPGVYARAKADALARIEHQPDAEPE